jgi:hypothetical protein
MKETKVIKPKFKIVEVPDGTKEVTVYITDDGKEFAFAPDARRYEYDLYYNLIENFEDFVGNYWYKCKNEMELNFIKDYFSFSDKSDRHYKIYGDIRVGEWFSVERIDGGDYPDKITVVSLEYYKEKLEDLFKRLV